MIKREWVDFNVVDVTEDDVLTFTKEKFEKIVGDKFVAVKVGIENNPMLIWTEKYVCPIKFEIMFGESPVMVFKRNPE